MLVDAALYRLVWESVEKSIQSKRSMEFPVRKSFENVLASRAVRTTVGKGENQRIYILIGEQASPVVIN